MNITNTPNIQSLQNIQGLQQTAVKGGIEPIRSTSSMRDSISFSEEALRLSDVIKSNTDNSQVRFDLVNRIKAEISAGSYDTPDKMDIALERMASRIF